MSLRLDPFCSSGLDPSLHTAILRRFRRRYIVSLLPSFSVFVILLQHGLVCRFCDSPPHGCGRYESRYESLLSVLVWPCWLGWLCSLLSLLAGGFLGPVGRFPEKGDSPPVMGRGGFSHESLFVRGRHGPPGPEGSGRFYLFSLVAFLVPLVGSLKKVILLLLWAGAVSATNHSSSGVGMGHPAQRVPVASISSRWWLRACSRAGSENV